MLRSESGVACSGRGAALRSDSLTGPTTNRRMSKPGFSATSALIWPLMMRPIPACWRMAGV